jgi:tetratricopeptide (TPR) repeat protein
LAGNKKIYEKAIRDGLDLAWAGNWEGALSAYEVALAEMPDDPAVHSHMGLACFELKQYEQALEAYTRASQLAPQDPAPLARVAEIHESMGQRHAAADALVSMAVVHQGWRDWTQAIEAYQRATRLYPDHLPARRALAEIYVQVDQPQHAVQEYLNLARAYERHGQHDNALEQCRRALEIDPKHPAARALAKALQRGESLDDNRAAHAPVEEGASPVDMARDKALEELAGIPFEETLAEPPAEPVEPEPGVATAKAPARPALSRHQIDALIAKAIDLQTRGLIDEAIASYTRVIDAGVDRPAAHFNLGLLFQQRFRFEPAIEEFKKAVHHPQYALGSHFAMGECYKVLGRIDDALEHFVQVLKIVDLGTVEREQADDLINLYDALADSYIAKGDPAKALSFTNALVDFLSSKGWEDKAREARQRLDSMSEEGVTMSLVEFLVSSNTDTILTAMSLSQEYVKRGAFTAATEVCYEAIEAAPTYLPLHLRLAEIFAQGDRIEDAVDKYQIVADLYIVREEPLQAIGVYKRSLRLQPMDVVARSRLIDLLISSGEIDQALEQYLSLADAYQSLAQADKALVKCTEALRLAPRASNETEWRVRLLRYMSDIHMRRADWQSAVQLYLQIVTRVPDDERARLNLIDLYYKLGRVKEADGETVALMDYYHARGEDKRALALLEEGVRLQPQQMPLRARMARAYIDAGRYDEAIQELDALGELQLDAGLRKQAMATVRFIISLNPRNIEAYRQLLAQL